MTIELQLTKAGHYETKWQEYMSSLLWENTSAVATKQREWDAQLVGDLSAGLTGIHSRSW